MLSLQHTDFRNSGNGKPPRSRRRPASVILRPFNLVLCRRPTAVPSCHKEAATTRLLPGENDALPSDDGHDTVVVASAAVAVRMPLPQVR